MITAQQEMHIGNGINDRMVKTMEIFPVFAIAGTVIGADNNERFAAGLAENVQ